MIQLNRIQLTSQNASHVEITNMLSTSQSESRIVDRLFQQLKSRRGEETGYFFVSSIDWCKVYERLAIRFEEKLVRLSSKTNIFTTQRFKFYIKDLFNKCE